MMEEVTAVNRDFKTLPYNLYTDSKVLEFEQREIFSKTWQFVCHESSVQNPGDYFTSEVAGKPIFISRDTDGSLRAFYNVCPHRGTKMLDDKGNKKVLQCPYHGWTFHLDGKLNQAPNFKNDAGFNPEDHCLHQIKLEVHSSLVFVNLDPSAKPLSEYYHDFFADFSKFPFISNLKVNRVKKRIIKCNWKVYIENYLECDHCPIAHPGFAATLDMNNYHILNGEYCNIQGGNMKLKNKKAALDVNEDEAEIKEARFYWLWPNFMLGVYPGSDNLVTNQMIPIDHETTLGIYIDYSVNEELTEERKKQIEFSEQVREEDVVLVERVQVGMKANAFEHGILSPTEHGLNKFRELMEQEYNKVQENSMSTK